MPDAKARLADMVASSSSNWWKDLLALWGPSGTGKAERPLRLAVRDNYLNFYLRGQSVARVAFDGQCRPYVDVHVKYAFAGAQDQAYARLTDAGIIHSKAGYSAPYAGASTLFEWMERAARWETAEKAEVERVVADNAGVIDLEMGLPAHGDQKTALRMDLIALEPNGRGSNVVFWEAKRITDGRLKARDGDAEVMSQINAYRAYLAQADHRRAVIEAYAQTCTLLVDFAEAASEGSKPLNLDPEVRRVATDHNRLDLDTIPRLVIFGTEEQLVAPAWQAHQEKLVAGNVPVLTIKTDAYRLDPPAGRGLA
jgi:hypothetical protein